MQTYTKRTPLSVKEDNDCVVRSIMTATGLSYIESHRFCTQWLDREFKDGVQYLENKLSCPKVRSQLFAMGYQIDPINCYYWRAWDGSLQSMNIGRFCKSYPKGTYIIHISGHALVIKNGTVHDWPELAKKLQRKVLLNTHLKIM